jgi:DNA-binding NtrC family response regulator
LTEVVRKAHEKNRLKRENLVLHNLVRHHTPQGALTRAGQLDVITRDEQMLAVLAQVELIAPQPAPVLISGESGTGKELMARVIHNASPQRARPFVVLNCATTPEAAVEAELFGHEAGVFATARTRRLGLFELAQGGTLFLEEVGCLSQASQARLQRALGSLSFYRIGGARKLELDTRIIASSSQNLSHAAQQGRFRPDLWQRLHRIRMALPPLRERSEDILPLTEHFLQTLAPNRSLMLAPDARRLLTAYQWPGNVRELRNVIERAVLLVRGNVIQPGDLLVELATRENGSSRSGSGSNYEPNSFGVDHGLGTVEMAAASLAGPLSGNNPHGIRLEEVEKREILAALERTNWHQGRTADLLGISPSTLYRRLREYKITKRMIRAQRATR